MARIPSSLVGQTVDGHRIDAVLGHGGMGVVYRAENLALGRPVALKFINPSLAENRTFLRRFRREARALAQIHHPNIVLVYDFRETDAGFYIAMEYVDGMTLAEQMEVHGALPWTEVVPLMKQMLAAFAYAHARGVIHRDIKPRNIMLTREGQVKVTDFGLAKVLHDADPDGDTTLTQGVAGTLYYMSPEQIRGLKHVDHRSDLFSLGLTLYELLAGQLPFDKGASGYTIQKTIAEEDIQFPKLHDVAPALPPDLAGIVMKALAKNPDERYPSADVMLADVRAFEARSSGPVFDVLPPVSPTDVTRLSEVGDSAAPSGHSPSSEEVEERLAPRGASAGNTASARASARLPSAAASGTGPSAPGDAPRRIGRYVVLAVLVLGVAGLSYAFWSTSGDLDPPPDRRPAAGAPAPNDTLRTPREAARPAVADALDQAADSAEQLPSGIADLEETPASSNEDGASFSQRSSEPDSDAAVSAQDEPVRTASRERPVTSQEPRSISESSDRTPTPEPAPPPTGLVHLTSSPSGATVYLDDVHRGITPLTLPEVPAARYAVRMELEGHEPFGTTIDVSAEDTQTVTGMLAPQMGALRIQVQPWGTVYIDGELVSSEVGPAVTFPLTATQHTIRVVHPSFGAWQETVAVPPTPDAPYAITVDFSRTMDVPITAVDEQGQPVPNGAILVDGEPTGQFTPALVPLSVGLHRIEVRADGYDMAAGALEMNVDETVTDPVRIIMKKVQTP